MHGAGASVSECGEQSFLQCEHEAEADCSDGPIIDEIFVPEFGQGVARDPSAHTFTVRYSYHGQCCRQGGRLRCARVISGP